MEMVTDEKLLEKIEAFIAANDIKPSRFGLDAMGDGALIPQLRAGRSLSLRNAEKVLLFMEGYGKPVADPSSPFPDQSGGTIEAAAA